MPDQKCGTARESFWRNRRREECRIFPPAGTAAQHRSAELHGAVLLWMAERTFQVYSRKLVAGRTGQGHAGEPSCLWKRPFAGSLCFCRFTFNFKRHNGSVIERFNPGCVLSHRRKDRVHNFLRGSACHFGDDLFQAFPAKKLAVTVARVEYSIAKEHE